MFADAVEVLAALLAVGWLALLALVGTDRRRFVVTAVLGAAVLLFGGAAWLGDRIADAGGVATRVDLAAQTAVAAHRTPALTAVAETLNVAGSLAGLAVPAAVVAVVLLRRRRWVEAALVVAAPVVAGVVGDAAKLGYDRSRPPAALHLVAVTDSSLPSGHTLDATLVLGVLAVVAVASLRRTAARLAVVAAAGVGIVVAGAARVYLGVHWATDVVAGWLLGGAGVALAVAVLLLSRRTSSSFSSSWSRSRRRSPTSSWAARA